MKKAGFSKTGILLLTAVLIALLSVTAVMYRKESSDGTGNPLAHRQEEKPENTPVELFVLAPCESCHEEDKFEQAVLSQLTKAGFENPDCYVYNVYKDSGTTHFEKTVRKYRLELTLADLPAAIVGGAVYQGTYQEIGEAVARHLETGVPNGGITNDGPDPETNTESLANSVFYHEISNALKNDTVLVLFVTGACESCQTAEEYLQDSLFDEKFNLLIYNILDDENSLVLRRLMELYDVPESGQQVPLLFSPEAYLSGAEAIVNGTGEMLEAGKAAGSWGEILSRLSQEREITKLSKIQLTVTGFLNGLNPCGISMLLMILSILLMSGRNFYGGSLIFLTGKFLTYLFLGFTIGTLFSVIEGTAFQTLQKGMKAVFSILAFCFGFFYLMDFIHVVKKEYGREKLRLPERFRKWNHNMIRKLVEIPECFWYPVLFLLGIVISAGEFLCTGQVYLASLLYMVNQNEGFDMQLAGNLTLYLTAMCVPMVLVVLLVSKGKSVMSASHLSLKILPAVKLAYSVFFFALFLSLLF